MVSYDFKYQNLSSFLLVEIVISCQCVYQIQAIWRYEMNRWTWHHHANDQLDIITQSAKVQNRHGKQLNFMYYFVLEHTKGLATPTSLWFARKTLNFWYQSKFRMTVTVWNWSVKTTLLGGLQTWFEPCVSEDADGYQVALTSSSSNYKRNKCQFHWTVFIKMQRSLS